MREQLQQAMRIWRVIFCLLIAQSFTPSLAGEPNPPIEILGGFDINGDSAQTVDWDKTVLNTYSWANGLSGYDGLLFDLYCLVRADISGSAQLFSLSFEPPENESIYFSTNDATHRGSLALGYRPGRNTITMILSDALEHESTSTTYGDNTNQKCTDPDCGYGQSPWYSEWPLLPAATALNKSDINQTYNVLNIRLFVNSVNSFLVVKNAGQPLSKLLQYQYLEFGFGSTMDSILQDGSEFDSDGVVASITSHADNASAYCTAKGIPLKPSTVSVTAFQNNPMNMAIPANRHWRNMNVRDQMRFDSTNFMFAQPPLRDFPIAAAATISAILF